MHRGVRQPWQPFVSFPLLCHPDCSSSLLILAVARWGPMQQWPRIWAWVSDSLGTGLLLCDNTPHFNL